MLNLVTLRNRSLSPQQIIYQGHAIMLDINEEKSFSKDIADVFSEECGPLVEEVRVETIGAIFKDNGPPTTLWVANITGNVELPEFVYRNKTVDSKTGAKERVAFQNQLRNPTNLIYTMKGNEVQYTAAHGQPNSYIAPPVVIDVPIYQRRELPANVARWALTRDRSNEFFNRGQLIKSRPPTTFEPEISWALDDLRIYLKLCDPKANFGPSENDLRMDKKGDEAEIALFDSKRIIMKRLFFRIVNPAVRLPTKNSFDDMKRGAGMPEQKITAARAAELLQKAKHDARSGA